MIYIGIDPGESTGLAIWDSRQGKITIMTTTTFWGAINTIKLNSDSPTHIHVVIEDCTQNAPVFGIENTYRSTKGLHANKLRAVARQGINVGTVMEKTKLMIKWLEDNNILHSKVRPTKKSATKLKADTFNNITKWNKRTNEHQRDAAMLVFGR